MYTFVYPFYFRISLDLLSIFWNFWKFLTSFGETTNFDHSNTPDHWFSTIIIDPSARRKLSTGSNPQLVSKSSRFLLLRRGGRCNGILSSHIQTRLYEHRRRLHAVLYSMTPERLLFGNMRVHFCVYTIYVYVYECDNNMCIYAMHVSLYIFAYVRILLCKITFDSDWQVRKVLCAVEGSTRDTSQRRWQ